MAKKQITTQKAEREKEGRAFRLSSAQCPPTPQTPTIGADMEMAVDVFVTPFPPDTAAFRAPSGRRKHCPPNTALKRLEARNKRLRAACQSALDFAETELERRRESGLPNTDPYIREALGVVRKLCAALRIG